MHDNDRILENRINRELIERILPAEVLRRVPLASGANVLPGEPMEAATAIKGSFEPISAGTPWGRPWGTTWFRASGPLPDDPTAGSGLAESRCGTEVACEIGFTAGMVGFSAEGAIHTLGDRGPEIRCGIHPMRRTVPLGLVTSGEEIDFWVEAASNPDFTTSFTANPMGSLATAGEDPLYTFGGFWMTTVDLEVRALIAEIGMLNDAMRVLPRGHRRRQRLAALFQRAYDRLDPADVRRTAPGCREVLAEGFEWTSPPDSHLVSAVGHAHIDTAWLWPMRETHRKCARTFANQVQLMEQYPQHRFACSQAQQYAWVEQDHPSLFERIRERVETGQWVPVGGMWVEADMNLPSGESLLRQMVHGQRYFESRFGRRCDEVWIPDVFGYPGNLPQVYRSGGCGRFVTQKLSWNKTNRFPHHTFIWEGIDGSEVLAHFPPVETYNAEVTVRELDRIQKNFAEHRWSDHSLMPFGHGDGGGGPTAEMLERAERLADLAELPRLAIQSPAKFFDHVEAEIDALDGLAPPRWRGELYFEMHRGTFTTQAATKVGNRRCEDALREAELWCATTRDDSRTAELDTLWKRVLTQQFHDVIPGSSIAWAHDDAEAEHAAVLEAADAISEDCLQRLAPVASTIANTCSTQRREVTTAAEPPQGSGVTQRLSDGSIGFLAEAPALGLGGVAALEPNEPVSLQTDPASGAITIANGLVALSLSAAGDVESVVDLRCGRELLRAGEHAGRLCIAPDTPVEYDAWDLEQWTAARSVPLPDAQGVAVLDSGPLVASVRVLRSFGGSRAEQTITLRADSARIDFALEVDWQEREELLTIDFPLDIRADSAACEVQFGHENRPTHRNTTWDDAKFEVCAQRWVDYSEPAFGAAVLNDGRHGHALQDGGVRVSLLRAPRYPDPDADRGVHRTTLSLLPHGPGLAEVVAEAEALNRPLRVVSGTASRVAPPLLSVSGEGVQVSAVKPADDGSGDVVVRFWSATGDRIVASVGIVDRIAGAVLCNALEEPDPDAPEVEIVDGEAVVHLGPHRFATLRLATG
jgi:alpha-mannosidase